MPAPTAKYLPTICLLAAAGISGCAGRFSPGAPGAVPATDAPLTAADIQRTDSRNAYDAVRLLRPAFLSILTTANRGTLEPEPTIVYVDLARAGSLEALRLIPASEVVSIQVVKPMHTMLRLGQGHRGGAILVETRR